jgi:hypothetical protein
MPSVAEVEVRLYLHRRCSSPDVLTGQHVKFAVTGHASRLAWLLT